MEGIYKGVLWFSLLLWRKILSWESSIQCLGYGGFISRILICEGQGAWKNAIMMIPMCPETQ